VTEADAQSKGGQPDKSAVISFESGATLLSPLADPSMANFTGIGAFGGTCIACGINTAHSVLLAGSAGEEPPLNRDGIVVLTDGQDEDVGAIIAEIEAAAAEGIRTSIGFLAPPPSPVPPARVSSRPTGEPAAHASLFEEERLEPDPALVSAIQASGGIAATISSAQAQRSFVDVVLANGLTAVDDPNGTDDGGILAIGIQVRGRIDPGSDSDTWSYTLHPKERVRVTLAGPRKVLTVRLAKSGEVLKKIKTKGVGKTANFVISDKHQRKLEMVVTSSGGKVPGYRIGVAKAAPTRT
jgi:hypothetical protein